jgi:hypothetical protein
MTLSRGSPISGSGFVSDDRTDDGLLKVHGVALGNNDVTKGSFSGKRKLWRPEVLQEAGSFLEGKDIVVDHENKSARETVGEITEAKFDEERGIIYQGVVQDEELEPKIENGWLEVSPRIIHSKDSDEVDGIESPSQIFDIPNLSIVRKGASKSNTLNVGEMEELSVEELESAFDSEEDESVDEYQFRTEELQSKPEDFDLSRWLYESPQGAIGASQKFSCDGGVHEHEIEGTTWYMPCSSHDNFLESLKQLRKEELAKFEEDDFVTWDNGSAHGRIVDWTDDGVYDASIDGDVSVEGTEDDPAGLIQIYQETDGGWSPTDTMVGHKFSTLNEWNPENVIEENAEVEQLQISEARTPEYSGTETKSWDDVPKTLEEFLEGVSGDTSEVDIVDELSESQKQDIANHTLLGDSEAETLDGLLFFPVVNPNNSNLNRGALEAVRSGRGQSADIPQSTFESAFSVAGRLLNEEFDADVEEEMMVSSFESAVETVELQVDEEELDDVYSEWSETVNMTASELRGWSGNPCSREASVDPEAVIERNLNLLETPKSEWGEDEIEDANRTISFINRMSAEENEPDEPRDGSFGCPSNWAISLLNWAFNPFDDVPNQPDNDNLDDVEEVEMAKHGKEMTKEERKLASMLSSHSEMTKQESMGIISSINPNRQTDVSVMAKMTAIALGAHEDEMRQFMKRMADHEGEMSRENLRDMMKRHVSENKSKLNDVFK